jgi:hypothetical protein
MFVRDFIHVGHPFEVVAPRFVTDTSWLAPIAEAAARTARETAQSLQPASALGGPDGGTGPPATGIRCEVGPVRARARSILVPMWLISEGRSPALPDLSGDLEVAPVGTARSLLALGATYRRSTHDRDHLQRVERATEAGVRTFLSGIAASFGDPVPAV